MRSKEVDKNIIVLKTQRDILMTGHNLKTTDEYSRLNLAKMYTSIINYISELEELPNKIRDKISLYELEIETLKTLYPKSYAKDDEYKLYVIKIQALKEIIGE